MQSDSFYLPRASVLPIMAVGIEEGSRYQGRSCYRLQGMWGIFRRTPRQATGLEAGEGNTVCHVGKKLIEVRPWVEANDFLQGLFAAAEDEGMPL